MLYFISHVCYTPQIAFYVQLQQIYKLDWQNVVCGRRDKISCSYFCCKGLVRWIHALNKEGNLFTNIEWWGKMYCLWMEKWRSRIESVWHIDAHNKKKVQDPICYHKVSSSNCLPIYQHIECWLLIEILLQMIKLSTIFQNINIKKRKSRWTFSSNIFSYTKGSIKHKESSTNNSFFFFSCTNDRYIFDDKSFQTSFQLKKQQHQQQIT